MNVKMNVNDEKNNKNENRDRKQGKVTKMCRVVKRNGREKRKVTKIDEP